LINVSDDDDLQTAYEVAEKDFNGKLRLIVTLKDYPSRLNCKISGEKLQVIPE